MTEYGIRELKYRVKGNKLLTFEEKKYISKALEEIQQYRAIGTVEQLKTLQEDYWKLNEISKEYSAIGTVEEFKSLKEAINKIKFVLDEKHYSNAEECDYGNYYSCEKALMVNDIEEILTTLDT